MLKAGTGDYYGFQFRKRENDLRICAWLSRLGELWQKIPENAILGYARRGSDYKKREALRPPHLPSRYQRKELKDFIFSERCWRTALIKHDNSIYAPLPLVFFPRFGCSLLWRVEAFEEFVLFQASVLRWPSFYARFSTCMGFTFLCNFLLTFYLQTVFDPL